MIPSLDNRLGTDGKQRAPGSSSAKKFLSSFSLDFALLLYFRLCICLPVGRVGSVYSPRAPLG